MQIDRYIQRLGTFEDRPEALVIDEQPLTVDDGEAMHHGALEAVLGDGALELIGGGLRIGRRQRGKGGKARWMRLHRQMQPVVGLTCQPDRADRVEPVRAGRTLRDDLKVHTCLVHLADAQLAQIKQAVTHLARA